MNGYTNFVDIFAKSNRQQAKTRNYRISQYVNDTTMNITTTAITTTVMIYEWNRKQYGKPSNEQRNPRPKEKRARVFTS